jgi:hypothetical protein
MILLSFLLPTQSMVAFVILHPFKLLASPKYLEVNIFSKPPGISPKFFLQPQIASRPGITMISRMHDECKKKKKHLGYTDGVFN